MRITFLGTAAAQGYPNPFCDCDHCERARVLGGQSLRTRSAALINDDLLIDLGPDLIAASHAHDRPLTRVQYCLQTHPHADHLDPSHLLSRSPGYGVPNAPSLQFYASIVTIASMERLLAADIGPRPLLAPEVGELLNLEIHQIAPLQTFTAGPYRVTTVPATHGPAGEALLYAIEGQGRNLFYGTDTGPLADEAWQALRRHQRRFDVVVLDHTNGEVMPTEGHLNAQQFVDHVARLRDEGLLADGARVFATHLAHDTCPPHPELVALAAQRGYEIAYDGLTV